MQAKSVAQANTRSLGPSTDSRARPCTPIEMTALEGFVILRQRSPWQSQGLPTKDLCNFRTATIRQECVSRLLRDALPRGMERKDRHTR
jgi:hypothetical protein